LFSENRIAVKNGWGKVEFFEDKTGAAEKTDNLDFKAVNAPLQKGDRLVISDLFQLGSALRQIFKTLGEFVTREIDIYVVNGGWKISGSSNSSEILTILAMINKLLHDYISSRTMAALKSRRDAGLHVGRPKGTEKSKLDKHREEIIELLKHGSTKAYIARRFKTTAPNLFIWLKKHKIDIKPDIILPKECNQNGIKTNIKNGNSAQIN